MIEAATDAPGPDYVCDRQAIIADRFIPNPDLRVFGSRQT